MDEEVLTWCRMEMRARRGSLLADSRLVFPRKLSHQTIRISGMEQ